MHAILNWWKYCDSKEPAHWFLPECIWSLETSQGQCLFGGGPMLPYRQKWVSLHVGSACQTTWWKSSWGCLHLDLSIISKRYCSVTGFLKIILSIKLDWVQFNHLMLSMTPMAVLKPLGKDLSVRSLMKIHFPSLPSGSDSHLHSMIFPFSSFSSLFTLIWLKGVLAS